MATELTNKINKMWSSCCQIPPQSYKGRLIPVKASTYPRRELHILSVAKITFSFPNAASVGSHLATPMNFTVMPNCSSEESWLPFTRLPLSSNVGLFLNCQQTWKCRYSERFLDLTQCQAGIFLVLIHLKC